MGEPWLCIVSTKNVFVMKSNSMKLKSFVDWESISSADFDLSADISEILLRPFELDSKIYLSAGFRREEEEKKYITTLKPTCKIYEFGIIDEEDEKKPQGEKVPKKSPQAKVSSVDESIIPATPIPFGDSFVANINGNLYFLKSCSFYFFLKRFASAENGLWVLPKENKDNWEKLSLPPQLEDKPDHFAKEWIPFVLNDKIFLRAIWFDGSYFGSFDPSSKDWKTESNAMIESFIDIPIHGLENDCYPTFLVNVPGISNAGNHPSVALSLSEFYPENHPPPPHDYLTPSQRKLAITAMLVDHDTGLLLYQPFHECFIVGGVPLTFLYGTVFHKFVNLGNGNICAVVFGRTMQCDLPGNQILCILIFTLAKLEDDSLNYSTLQPPRMEKHFVSLNVVRKSVFSIMEPSFQLLDAFACPSNK